MKNMVELTIESTLIGYFPSRDMAYFALNAWARAFRPFHDRDKLDYSIKIKQV